MDVKELFPGIFDINFGQKPFLATLNLTSGRSFYGEQLIQDGDREYRAWTPYRSKLAAAIVRGIRNIPLTPGSRVLYLGVASGTTCSHISDIVGAEGHVWGVEISPRPLRDLIDNLSRHRGNISPIMGDARLPESYSSLVPRVDMIYSDVAQPHQSSIVARNSELFLKPAGWIMMAIKSRSVDVTLPPSQVYKEQVEKLKMHGFNVYEVVHLDPYERDHSMAVAKYRG